jgi:DNA-binding Lrp family transcriptional regulator
VNKMDRILQRLESGIPIVPEPFKTIAADCNATVSEVLAVIQHLESRNSIRRFGVVVNHKAIGFESNAMCVWDVPDTTVSEIGKKMKSYEFVTLCYRRKRSLPAWPYNLYCMIHGQNQNMVLSQYRIIKKELDLDNIASKILFSTKTFKQRGAKYMPLTKEQEASLLNRLQDGLSIEESPFLQLANDFNLSESELLSIIEKKLLDGSLTRFGPMFNVEKFGGEFTLVAMKVPEDQFHEVTKVVNAHVEVAHNYRREHALNMWFVTATDSKKATEEVLETIESETGLKTFAMPKLEEYFLDLRFKL